MIHRALAQASTLVIVPAAGAAAAAAPATPTGAGGLVQVLLSLLFILALIVALAWLATRLRLTPRSASSALKVLADVPVGPKERVVLIRVGDAQALVGVGADGVRALTLLDRRIELPEGEPSTQAFAHKLQAAMRGKQS